MNPKNAIARRMIFLSITLLIALIYALPNLYPNVAVVQVTSEQIQTEQINILLNQHSINYQWINPEAIGFESVESQMQANDILSNAQIPDHSFAINLQSATPSWLSVFGAEPMKLGLDLQGGVHFLLHVQENTPETTDAEISKIENLLMDEGIRYDHVQFSGATYLAQIKAEKDIQRAKILIESSFNTQANMTSSSLSWTNTSEDRELQREYAIEQTIQSLENRINELGISEAQIARQGLEYISIDLPGVQDIAYAKKIIGKTATLRFHLVSPSAQTDERVYDQHGNAYPLEPKAILSGNEIIYANARMEQMRPVVDIKLNGKAHNFYDQTAASVGQPLAVVYSELKKIEESYINEEQVISAPVIRQPLGDSFFIQGLSSFEEAQDLALLLRSGALAAPVEFVEETIIGPSLGEDNIQKGILSLAIGTLCVSAFMAYYYGALGMIANIALYMNVIITLACLSIIGATLTLPGIAGIVLSVGMAVDANVLINERIREEYDKKKSLRTILNKGYDNALSAIVDANITTLLVTLVLFFMGSGAIKGFAVTTSIGILISIFTAVYATRIISTYLIDKNILTSFGNNRMWFKNIPQIAFMKIRHKTFLFSSVLLGASILLIPLRGLNLGLDFTGGTQVVLEFAQDTNQAQINSILHKHNITDAQIQTYGSSNVFIIKSANAAKLTKTTLAAITQDLPGSKVLQNEFIGPQVGQKMLSTGIIAILCSLLISLFYVTIRFDLRFAISAIISLIHDPILILGLFSLFQIEFNLIALAAILTTLGYSINDTIVVYDRVRESMKNDTRISTTQALDNGINQTLSRTILTSGLTLSVVISLYLFSGTYLHGFSIAFAIGIIIGTYSSIYVAGALALKLGLKREHIITPINNEAIS
ncbi:protein translocase subunit SecD [Candidatus Comchoanobacter bicostacola]|uniref:Multifunctional fusion protein n=1 Tax=Candidatus Comchoanobacter bicostacola TaxID=2919598 RepID=A0ABY5DHA8_9GAMM|nr:protein translocase subunit SecD [Candidatus Comchoanobacter bicostacola]UTC24136.1 protein translocase subunit SecD [Candidatus Comchoanobacter bicostacola]